MVRALGQPVLQRSSMMRYVEIGLNVRPVRLPNLQGVRLGVAGDAGSLNSALYLSVKGSLPCR